MNTNFNLKFEVRKSELHLTTLSYTHVGIAVGVRQVSTAAPQLS